MKTKILCAVLAVSLAFAASVDCAFAKRMGGGGSFGGRSTYSRSYSPSQSAPYAPSAPAKPGQMAPQGAPNAAPVGAQPGGMFGRMGWGLGGFMAGGLLGSMLFGHGGWGAGGGGIGLLDLILIGLIAYFAVRLLRGRMDGSAASFVYLLNQAGLRRQAKARKVLAVTKPIVFEREGKFIKATPHDGFAVDYTIQFAHPLIGRQNLAMEVTPDAFAADLAKARTFGFLREVEYLHANGLALGGNLDNAVVLDEFGVLNTDGLRYSDEFVRHKLLDFVGDMAVMGLPLQGRFEVFASGHALNNSFLRYLEDHASEYLEERTLLLPEAAPAEAPAKAPAKQPVSSGLRQPAMA